MWEGHILSQKSHPCVVSGLLELLHSFCVPDCLVCGTTLHTVVMTKPSQSALSEQRVHTGRLAQYMESALDMFSCHDLPMIRRMFSQVVRGAVEYAIISL